MNVVPSHYSQLKDKWTKKHRVLQEKLWDKHGQALGWLSNNSRSLAIGSLGSLILLTSPRLPTIQIPHTLAQEKHFERIDKTAFLMTDLSRVLPHEIRPLIQGEEKQVLDVLRRDLNLPLSSELEGIRLNRSYGLIGAEQHLMRFPGDNVDTHFESDEKRKAFESSGLAPGLGAWGYFAPSQTQLTEKDIENEKYYIAVQTFLAPGFNENVRRYITFFKYRKMLVVNPNNGRAMVVVVGDAGPGESTGKHLGGSPEVMKYLERVDGAQKGPVLYFFIDDPEDKIPLGPFEVK